MTGLDLSGEEERSRSVARCFASLSMIGLDLSGEEERSRSSKLRSGYPPPFMGREERTLPAGRNPLRGSVFERNTQTAPLRQACACSGGVLPHIPFATDCQRESGLGRRPHCLVDCHSTTRSSVPFKRPRILRCIPDLGQASLAVTPVSLPLARWVRSQAHPV